MRPRAVLLALAVAVVAFAYATRGPEPGASARPADRTAAPPRAPTPALSPDVELPTRNVFEYGAAPAGDAGPPPRISAPRPTLATAPAPEPSPVVRLVGLLRQGAALKAALSIRDELMVLGRGESGAGYTVVGIDEEEGVTVRTPDGGTLRLTVPID